MQAPRALLAGLVSLLLPPANYDDNDSERPIRIGRYREVFTLPAVRKSHTLGVEGSYLVTHNAQTGIISSLIGTAFSHTALSPYLLINNTDTSISTGGGGKSINVDYVNLICTAAGAAAAGLTLLNFAWTVDQVNNRWSAGGTDITQNPAVGGGTFSPNGAVGVNKGGVSHVYCGALTLNAPSSGNRIIIPQRQLRQLNTATAMCVAQDNFNMNFGAVEQAGAEVDIGTAKTVAINKVFNLPGLVIPPGGCGVLHLWSPGAALTTGVSFLPEIGSFER